jgi:Uma2 family endonuclease
MMRCSDTTPPWWPWIAGRPSYQSSAAGSPLCPDLVVELASPSDAGPRSLTALRQKRAAYQRNGARLGRLLIPAKRAVEVWGALQGGDQGRQIEAAIRIPSFRGW